MFEPLDARGLSESEGKYVIGYPVLLYLIAGLRS